MVKAEKPANDGIPEKDLGKKRDGKKIKKSENGGTPFSWKNGEISKDCSWNEFQKKTNGSQKNKAEAYYKHTGKPKGFKAREEYMGGTPLKDSPTGRAVIRRMYMKELDKFKFPKDKKQQYINYLLDEDRYKYEALPEGFLKTVYYEKKRLTRYDMGHISPDDAVTKWNDLFSKLGEEEGKKLARKWMKDPEIYELQLRSDNRSAGRGMKKMEGINHLKLMLTKSS